MVMDDEQTLRDDNAATATSDKNKFFMDKSFWLISSTSLTEEC